VAHSTSLLEVFFKKAVGGRSFELDKIPRVNRSNPATAEVHSGGCQRALEEPKPGIINAVAYRGGRRDRVLTVEQVPAALADPELFVWVGLYEPDEQLLVQVQEAFQLHELAVEDAHRAHQRPKLERYGDSHFLVLRTVHLNEEGCLQFGETHVFIGERFLVTVRHGSYRSHVGVRARCEAEPENLKRGVPFVLYALLDFVVDQYFPVLEELEDRFALLEEDVFDGHLERQTTERLYGLRRDIVGLRRALEPLLDVCRRLEQRTIGCMPEDLKPYYRDVHDHVLRLLERLGSLGELARSALEAHLSLLSISQAEDTRKLAAWAAIIAVPTMVAGIYGMNFEHMPELRWHLGYPVVLLTMAVACLLLYRAFKRSGWL
jgi:magnesium transporter